MTLEEKLEAIRQAISEIPSGPTGRWDETFTDAYERGLADGMEELGFEITNILDS